MEIHTQVLFKVLLVQPVPQMAEMVGRVEMQFVQMLLDLVVRLL